MSRDLLKLLVSINLIDVRIRGASQKLQILKAKGQLNTLRQRWNDDEH